MDTEHIFVEFLGALMDDEIELFIKAVDEVKAFVKVNRFNPSALPSEFTSETPQGFQAVIMKKLIPVSNRLNKLILEIRIDIKRFVRLIFAFDDDNQCSLLFFTFGFEKKRSIEDFLTNTYAFHTKEVLSRYSKNILRKGCDYDEG